MQRRIEELARKAARRSFLSLVKNAIFGAAVSILAERNVGGGRDRGERRIFNTQVRCFITWVGCSVTPAQPAPPLKRPRSRDLRVSEGHISHGFSRQDI